MLTRFVCLGVSAFLGDKHPVSKGAPSRFFGNVETIPNALFLAQPFPSPPETYCKRNERFDRGERIFILFPKRETRKGISKNSMTYQQKTTNDIFGIPRRGVT